MGQVRYINIPTCMTPRRSGQVSIFGVVFLVLKSLLRIKRQKKLKNLQFLSESLGAMLEYQICLTPPLGEVKAVKPL